jgi:hypothetical protein
VVMEAFALNVVKDSEKEIRLFRNAIYAEK